ncbi:hypothetical protein PIB30_103774 [Stylosanthes scabra]|uniref:Uncharacterized protein n=1 Tax=Stylosanthes scabra TaxID=79078 RepID=A0ABU6SYI8_9FABA|nr:hypothetical protein [Stylosanthes scabra]
MQSGPCVVAASKLCSTTTELSRRCLHPVLLPQPLPKHREREKEDDGQRRKELPLYRRDLYRRQAVTPSTFLPLPAPPHYRRRPRSSLSVLLLLCPVTTIALIVMLGWVAAADFCASGVVGVAGNTAAAARIIN